MEIQYLWKIRCDSVVTQSRWALHTGRLEQMLHKSSTCDLGNSTSESLSTAYAEHVLFLRGKEIHVNEIPLNRNNKIVVHCGQ